ncbi:hypothetical protein BST81_25175 [Leptolyngbya sp. 'hensonii']|uniref:WbqC family protein n=1 Tax=Leptolyngbya sp. 'hensonii' TaxID=1922337 RepID=UPI0009501B27|nr:WbqC family protein [Leptolyngbya sp. 'hensonii']OLP15647.1 hypothetical protein BST81_25175 [Leptolyngbya sp. 'hensonii']
MILSAHQPAYLPWLGYFDKLLRSDLFIFLDTVQYEKNSFINRNRIKTPQGPVWLTIPVKTKGHISSTMLETEIDSSQNWREKHLKSIYLNYRKAPYFEICYPKLECLYQQKIDLLADLCFEHLSFWLQELGVSPQLVRSSALPIASKKSDLIFDLCSQFQADRYISGTLGQDYLEVDRFQAAGISIEFQDYRHPSYPQLYGNFLPYMGIVDLWMNSQDFSIITGQPL